MSKFLLDANLSPKVGKFLSKELGFDVESLQGLRLGDMLDPHVARRGSSTGRVVITMDSDFESASTSLFEASGGVIYLDLPNKFRVVPEICRILSEFFAGEGSRIELEETLVVITPDGIDVSRTIRRLRPKP